MKTEVELLLKLDHLRSQRALYKQWAKNDHTPVTDAEIDLLEWILE